MGEKNIICTECGQTRKKLKAGTVPRRKDYPLFNDQKTKDWLSICRQVEDWLRKEMATTDCMEYPVRYKLILEYAPASPNFREQVVLREDVITRAKAKDDNFFQIVVNR